MSEPICLSVYLSIFLEGSLSLVHQNVERSDGMSNAIRFLRKKKGKIPWSNQRFDGWTRKKVSPPMIATLLQLVY